TPGNPWKIEFLTIVRAKDYIAKFRPVKNIPEFFQYTFFIIICKTPDQKLSILFDHSHGNADNLSEFSHYAGSFHVEILSCDFIFTLMERFFVPKFLFTFRQIVPG